MSGKKARFFATTLSIATVFLMVAAYLTRGTGRRSDTAVTVEERTPPPTITRAELDEAFLNAVRSHPRREISEGLYGKLKDKTIRYSFDIEPSEASASFVVLSGANVVPPQDAGVRIPALYIQPDIVADSRKDLRGLRELQSVLFHEYQHYVQWSSATDGTTQFDFGSKRLRRGDCLALWRNELLAYLAQCELDKEQAWESSMPRLCEAFGDPTLFKSRLFERLSMPAQRLGYLECVDTWRDGLL